ncbi:MAG TPA: flagellar hook assembly protein FlgD [Kofleriaceae bacterium]|jgi:flagellar basal-body rod modification protein FlgD
MTSITGVSDTTTNTTTTTGTGGALKGTQDEFLKLFMAQLQYQDPFAPTSNAEMVGQLAQISGVEQAKQTNAQIADLASAQAAVANANLSSLVGRDCSSTLGSFSVDATGGTPPPMNVTTANATKGATIDITDSNGKVVRTLPIPDGTTNGTIQWDGKDASGAKLPAGSYSIAINKGDGASEVTGSWAGRVDAVELTSAGPRLRIGGVLVSPGDIHTIGNSSSVTSATAVTGQ